MVAIKIKELDLNITYTYCWDEEYASKFFSCSNWRYYKGKKPRVSGVG